MVERNLEDPEGWQQSRRLLFWSVHSFIHCVFQAAMGLLSAAPITHKVESRTVLTLEA